MISEPGSYRQIQDYDHSRLAALPAYQDLRKAINDIANQSAGSDPVSVAEFLKAITDMALTTPYADICRECGNAGIHEMYWPHSAIRDGDWIRGQYRCRNGHSWSCGYSVLSTELG